MVLVVQFRDDITREHEQECIGRYAGTSRNVRFVSVFKDAEELMQPHELLEGVDKLILGGSAGISMGPGHEDVDYSKVEHILRTVEPLVRHVLAKDFPTLGVCFGHHLLGHFAGSPVVFDAEMAETGFHKMQLTAAGTKDPVLRGVSDEFWAVVGHQDSLAGLPEGATLLAVSDRCATQAVRYGRHVYGTQFHSELLEDDLLYRLALFPQYHQYAESLTPVSTKEAVRILQNFLRQL